MKKEQSLVSSYQNQTGLLHPKLKKMLSTGFVINEVKLVSYQFQLKKHMARSVSLNLQVVVMTGGMTGDLDTGIPNGIVMI